MSEGESRQFEVGQYYRLANPKCAHLIIKVTDIIDQGRLGCKLLREDNGKVGQIKFLIDAAEVGIFILPEKVSAIKEEIIARLESEIDLSCQSEIKAAALCVSLELSMLGGLPFPEMSQEINDAFKSFKEEILAECEPIKINMRSIIDPF